MARGDRRKHPGVLYYFIPLFCCSLWMRISFILDQPSVDWQHLSISLWRGVASDTAVTLLLALLCVWLSKIRFAPLMLCGLYCFMLAANGEFIIANDANLDFLMLNQALDASFIEGSVFTKTMAWKLLQSFGVLTAMFTLLRFVKPLEFRTSLSAGLALASLIFLGLSPISEESAGWIQTNALEDNIGNMRYLIFNSSTGNLDAFHTPPDYIERFFSKDLNGTPIVDYPKKKPNILLIAMESVGEQHLQGGKMPFLKSLSKDSLYYSNYVVSSQVTINGLYAMLCADNPGFTRPNIGSVKAWKLKKKNGELFCLPNFLESNGYHTAYMQSAPLKFQRKNSFIPMAGFRDAIGKEELDPGDKTPWGPDDKTLYQHALKKIDSMQDKENPWFMTILTISTHYPAVVPEEFYVMKNGKKKAQSHLFADMSLEYFISELKEHGVLENTVVVITNDEVRGSGRGTKGDIEKNHGILLVLTPEKVKAQIDDIFIQTDMFVSLADYLGLDTTEIPLGRSIFRRYENFRPVFFNNFFSKKFFVAASPWKILVCKSKAPDCETYQNTDGKLFNGIWEKTAQLKQWRWLIETISKRNDEKLPKKWNETKASGKLVTN